MTTPTLEAILGAVRQVVPADLAVILGAEESGLLRVLAAAGPLATPRLNNLLVDPAARPSLQGALAGRGPRLLNQPDHEEEPDTYADIVTLPGDHSCLVAPLRSEGLLLGALTLDAMSCGVFSDEAVRAIGAFADLAARAVHQERRADTLDRTLTALAMENASLRQKEGGGVALVGQSPAWIRAVEQIRLVAPTPSTVLLTGETGTGKEQAAQAIHQWSTRAHGPFVALNCSAVIPDLALSELFGHERGAFTGADRRRPGRFELAAGGTLFLDEIADLPSAAQAQLLRVLQEHTFERVGGETSLQADVRLIAATHQDLVTLVQGGLFREDLYYRLAGFPIHLPPLRERPGDLPLLAEHLVVRLRHRLQMPALGLESEARKALEHHTWPGNVRELANVLERGAILAGGGPVGPRHLSFNPPVPGAPGQTSIPAGFQMPARLNRLDAAVAKEILSALVEGGGKVAGDGGAAARLGIPATTLYSAIQRLGLRTK